MRQQITSAIWVGGNIFHCLNIIEIQKWKGMKSIDVY